MDPLHRVPCETREELGVSSQRCSSVPATPVDEQSGSIGRAAQPEGKEGKLTFGELFAPLTPCQIAPPVRPMALEISKRSVSEAQLLSRTSYLLTTLLRNR